jgi:glycosyltransferase involved in cell wall biosynthesis
MTSKSKRLAVLITHPVQYFKPVFQALAACEDLKVKVFFGCNHGVKPSHDPDFGVSFAWDSAPTAGFDHCFLSENPLANLAKPATAIQLAWKGSAQIHNWRADAVLIFAYSPLFITASTLILAAHGEKLLLRADGTDRAFQRAPWKSLLKDQLLRRYYCLFSQIFPIGSDSNDHFARLGVPPNRRKAVPFAVDVEYFQGQVEHWMPQRNELRRALQIPATAEVLLSVGKITPVKGPLLLAKALALLPAERQRQLWLVVVGDGPLREAFAAAIEEQLPGCSRFVGFQNQSQLGRYYAVADTLVFPSVQGETWGLVVNEALQFGLRVIASDHPGCARDLLGEAPHRLFPSGDPQALAQALRAPWTRANSGPIPNQVLPRPEQLAEAVASSLKPNP